MKSKFIILVCLTAVLGASAADPKRQLQEGLFEEQVNRDLKAAMEQYEALLKPYDAKREWVATAVFRLGECYRKLGQTNEMVAQFERVVREFSDQTNLVASAKLHLRAVGRLPEKTPAMTQMQREGWMTNAVSAAQTELQEIMRIVKDSPDRLFTSYKEHGSPMEYAISLGNVEAVKFLLQAGVSGGDRDRKGTPFLVHAVHQGNLSITKVLLPSATNDASAVYMALEVAAGQGYQQLAEYLLSNGVKPNAIPERCISALAWAVDEKKPELVELLIKNGADVNESRVDGKPLLCLAVKRGWPGKVRIAEMLLKAGAKPDARDDEGKAPLHLAANDRAMTEVLLKHGADPNIWSKAPTEKGWSFQWRDFQRRLKVIMGGSRTVTSRGRPKKSAPTTPLHVTYRVEGAKLLLDHGADVNARNGDSGATPLFSQVRRDLDRDMIRLLLKNGADPNAMVMTTSSGGPYTSSPFVEVAGGAREPKHLQIVADMLAAGANPDYVFSGGNHRSLLGAGMAESWASDELLRLLVNAGANPQLVPEEYAFLHAVDQGARRPILWELLPQLIKNGADVNWARDGFSPLKAAISRKATNVVAQLLTAGADPNQMDAKGYTVLDNVLSTLRSSTKDADRKVYEVLRKQLLDAGAKYVSGRDDAITFLHRNGYKWAPLLKENQAHSKFSLLELISVVFADSALPSDFHHPDFSEVRLHRRSGDDYADKTYDIGGLLADTNATVIPVRWGDVLEFETTPHRVGTQWRLPFEMRTKLASRLARRVTLKYGEKPESRVMIPLSSQPFSEGMEAGETLISNCWLRSAVLSAKELLSTHDLSRVVVEREDGEETKRWLFDVRNSHMYSGTVLGETHVDFWLRDGDVVTIPQKTDKVGNLGYPIVIGSKSPLGRPVGNRAGARVPPPLRVRR